VLITLGSNPVFQYFRVNLPKAKAKVRKDLAIVNAVKGPQGLKNEDF